MVLNSNQIILGVNSGQEQTQNLIGSTTGFRAYWSPVFDVPKSMVQWLVNSQKSISQRRSVRMAVKSRLSEWLCQEKKRL